MSDFEYCWWCGTMLRDGDSFEAALCRICVLDAGHEPHSLGESVKRKVE